jgi:hypothetical protein
MSEDDLRNSIWDNLFRTKSAKSVDELAAFTGHSAEDVRVVLNHEWFSVADDRVSIAYAPSNHNKLLG